MTPVLEAARAFGVSELRAAQSEYPGDEGLDAVRFLEEQIGEFTEKRRQKLNAEAKKALFTDWKELFETVEKNPLTDAQRSACVVNEDNTLVVAGAGTGETSTIMGKTVYLLKSGLAKLEEILLLAFNRKAAEEMRYRLRDRIGPDAALHITATTFHAFGLKVLKMASFGETPALTPLLNKPGAMQDFCSKTLIKAVMSSPDLMREMLNLQLDLRVPQFSEHDFETSDDYKEFLDSYPFITLKGEKVKSYGELLIANHLYFWRVNCEYEARFPIAFGRYTAAFRVIETEEIRGADGKTEKILKNSAWIEYFGTDVNGRAASWIPEEHYRNEIREKRALHARYGTRLIELTYGDLQKKELEQKLEKALKDYGFTLRPFTAEVFFSHIEIRTNGKNVPVWNGMMGLYSRFLGLFKASQLTLDELRAKLENSPRKMDRTRARLFLKFFQIIYDAYEEHLEANHEIDYSDMIRMCTRILERGRNLPYRYVLVDEFQDISPGRARFLHAILNAHPGARLFAVGDDWQEIYHFAGSDLRQFTRFRERFSPGTYEFLDRTYRFNNRLQELSSLFVTQNPEQLKKSIQTHKKSGEPAVTMRDIFSYPIAAEAALGEPRQQLVNRQYQGALGACLAKLNDRESKLGTRKATVLVLSRYRPENDVSHLPGTDFKRLAKQNPSLDIRYETVHRSKGLEADYVIILGLDNREFPNTRENDELFSLVLPESDPYLYAEERRLFYVAMTRARNSVMILYNGNSPSVFVDELSNHYDTDRYVQRDENAPRWHCFRCATGWLTKVINQSGTNRRWTSFYKCGNDPACDAKAWACRGCGSPMARYPTGEVCMNEECKTARVICPQCGSGYLVERKNRFNGNVFYGCTNYGKEDGGCSYTVNLGLYEKMKAELLRRAEKEMAEAKRLRKLEEEKKREERLAAERGDDEVPF